MLSKNSTPLLLFLFASIFGILATNTPGQERIRDKNGPTNADGVPVTADGLIDLMRADPSQVDLATIDPAKLHLTKEIVKRLDLDKWDLSQIDNTKVSDKLAAKWIPKVLKAKNALDKALSKYKPGELERLQNEKLSWLREPAPFVEPVLKRSHSHSQAEIARYAQIIDGVLRDKLRENGQDFNAPTTDQQFVRRVFISIAGRIPTADEVSDFMNSKRANKRLELIDDLLLREDYPSQMFNWLAGMLRVRELKSNQGETYAYQQWLIDQMVVNRPWGEVVTDLLTAEGDLVSDPKVGWLIRDANNPLGGLANTLTTFMGASVSCAECHDHPFNNYTQKNFYEMAAFFGSVDVNDVNVRAAPKVLKNRLHFVRTEPERFLGYPKDNSFTGAEPGSKVTPAFVTLLESAPRLQGTSGNPLGREDFARWMTNKNNQQFAATIANRLWAKIFGIPVMAPLTEMDKLDGAHNPRLIKALAQLMQDLDYDLMAFQRVIYNTRAYQSQASVTPVVGVPFDFPGPVLRRLSGEEAWDSIVTLVKGDKVNDYHRERRKLIWSQDVFKPGFFEYREKVMAKLDDRTRADLEFSKLVRAAGELSSKLYSSVAPKKKHGSDEDGFVRASELSQPAPENHFLRQFGQADRELADAGTLEGDIPQTLMLMNGSVGEKLSQSDSYIVRMANQLPSSASKIDFIYMSFLGRKPTTEERNFVSNERISLSDLAWMLMNSHEFMFVQ